MDKADEVDDNAVTPDDTNISIIRSISDDSSLPSSLQIPFTHIAGFKVYFSISSTGTILSFYPQQLEIIYKLLSCFSKGSHSLLESPTGTGKSVCILASIVGYIEATVQTRKEMEILTMDIGDDLIPDADADDPDSALRALEDKVMFEAFSSPAEDDPIEDDFSTSDTHTIPISSASAPNPAKVAKASTGDGSAFENTSSTMSTSTATKKATNATYKQFLVTSRTHKQLEQMVGSLKSIKAYRDVRREVCKKEDGESSTTTSDSIMTPLSITTAVLASRNSYCIHPGKQEWQKEGVLNESCRVLVRETIKQGRNGQRGAPVPGEAGPPPTCTFYERVSRLASDPAFAGAGKIADIEDLVAAGKEHKACPYYASKILARSADITFAPYNYILDPKMAINKHSMNSLVPPLKKIVIIDEAHNIEDNCTDVASTDLSLNALIVVDGFLRKMEKYDAVTRAYRNITFAVKAMIGVIEDYQDCVLEFKGVSKVWSGQDAVEMLKDLSSGEIKADLATMIREEIDNSYDDSEFPHYGLLNQHTAVVEAIADVVEYLFDDEARDHFHLVLQHQCDQDSTPPLNDFLLSLWCMNSSIIFKKLVDRSHSINLLSGTLAPLQSFAKELGTDFSFKAQCKHVITQSQFKVFTIPSSPLSYMPLKGTKQFRETSEYMTGLGQAILDAAAIIPSGILVFIQSYQMMDIFIRHWKQEGFWDKLEKLKHITMEPRNNKDLKHDIAISQYKNNCMTELGAIMFCVYRGRSSEGMDFRDEQCRGVLLVSIPFANMGDLRIQLGIEYHDRQRTLLSGNDWAKVSAFRALNQALGRAIRHQKDWGVCVLLDTRFNDPANWRMLPKWVMDFLESGNQNDYAEYKRDLTAFIHSRHKCA